MSSSSMPSCGPRFLMESEGMRWPGPRQREEYVELHRFLGEVLDSGDVEPTLSRWNTAWAELYEVYEERDMYKLRYGSALAEVQRHQRRLQQVLTASYRVYLRMCELEQDMAREEVDRADRALQADIDALLEAMSAEDRRAAEEAERAEIELQDALLAAESAKSPEHAPSTL